MTVVTQTTSSTHKRNANYSNSAPSKRLPSTATPFVTDARNNSTMLDVIPIHLNQTYEQCREGKDIVMIVNAALVKVLIEDVSILLILIEGPSARSLPPTKARKTNQPNQQPEHNSSTCNDYNCETVYVVAVEHRPASAVAMAKWVSPPYRTPKTIQ